MSCPEQAESDPNDLRRWVGALLSDIFDYRLTRELSQHVTELVWTQGLSDLERLRTDVAEHWSSYHAKTEYVLHKSGSLHCEFFDLLILGKSQKSDFFDWMVCDWLVNAVAPLVRALEEGLFGIEGQREPANVHQPIEALPYSSLADRLWEVHRDESRVDVINKVGEVQATFRQCRLTLSPKPPLPPVHVRVQIKEAMIREFDLTKGSQALAKEFRNRYPQHGIPLKALADLA